MVWSTYIFYMEQSSNHLRLNTHSQLEQQQKIQALLNPNEKIVSCVNIWKYNKDGRCQQRILVLTNHSLLNIVKNQNIFKSLMKKFVQFTDNYEVKRRIHLVSLYGITISPNRASNVFLIHVINDHDYYYKAVKNKLTILQMISEEYRKIAKKDLPFFFRDQTVILNYCTFKSHIREKKDPKPKQHPHFLKNDYFTEKEFQDAQYICEYTEHEKRKNILPKHFVRVDVNQIKSGGRYYVLKEESNRSIHISSFVEHPNILRPDYCFFNEKKELMFIPFMIGGCFKNYIDKYKPLNKDNLIFYVSQLILILERLRDQNKYYANLSLENIYVKGNGYLTLNGFQKIGELNRQSKTQKLSFKISGNPLYFSPQVVTCRGIQNDLDVWRLGVCSYYLWKGKFPFQGKNIKQIYYKILQQQIQEPDIPNFIGQLLQKNKKNRLTFQQLKKHRDFSGINWKTLDQQLIKAPFIVNIQHWSGKLPIVYQLNL